MPSSSGWTAMVDYGEGGAAVPLTLVPPVPGAPPTTTDVPGGSRWRISTRTTGVAW